jgi:hypothetical protein
MKWVNPGGYRHYRQADAEAHVPLVTAGLFAIMTGLKKA